MIFPIILIFIVPINHILVKFRQIKRWFVRVRNEKWFKSNSQVIEITGASDGGFLLVFGAGGVVVCDEEDATGAKAGGFGGEEGVCGEENVGHGGGFFGGFAEIIEGFVVYCQQSFMGEGGTV